MSIGHGRYIGHDQPAQQMPLGQRQLHRGFATHRVPQQICRPKACQHFGQIARHIGVALAVGAKTAAMVAHIHRDHITPCGQAAGNSPPVAP